MSSENKRLCLAGAITFVIDSIEQSKTSANRNGALAEADGCFPFIFSLLQNENILNARFQFTFGGNGPRLDELKTLRQREFISAADKLISKLMEFKEAIENGFGA